MKPNSQQQIMITDGMPKALLLTPEQRAAYWAAHPPRPSSWIDPRIEAERKLRTQMKLDAARQRIAKLRESKGLIDDASRAIKLQERRMLTYTIKPLDKRGHIVTRGMDSISIESTQAQIDEKVAAATQRGGKTIVHVLLLNAAGEVLQAWLKADAGDLAPIDAAPFQPKPQQPNIEDASGIIADADATPADAAAPEPGVAPVKETKMAKKRKAAAKKVVKPTTIGIVAEFGQRVGSNRERLLLALDAKRGEQVSRSVLSKKVYAKEGKEGALAMVAVGLIAAIKQLKLKYEIKKDGAGYGLYKHR